MSHPDFDEARLDVLAELAEYGAPAILTREDIERDPVTGAAVDNSPAPQNISALLKNYSQSETNQSGGLILQKDKEALIAAEGLTFAPAVNDKLTVGSTAYSIIGVKAIEPDNEAIIYFCHVRLQ